MCDCACVGCCLSARESWNNHTRHSTIKLSEAVIKHTENTDKSLKCKHTRWTTLNLIHTHTHTQRSKHSLQTTIFFFTPHSLINIKATLLLSLSLMLLLSVSQTHEHTHTLSYGCWLLFCDYSLSIFLFLVLSLTHIFAVWNVCLHKMHTHSVHCIASMDL